MIYNMVKNYSLSMNWILDIHCYLTLIEKWEIKNDLLVKAMIERMQKFKIGTIEEANSAIYLFTFIADDVNTARSEFYLMEYQYKAFTRFLDSSGSDQKLLIQYDMYMDWDYNRDDEEVSIKKTFELVIEQPIENSELIEIKIESIQNNNNWWYCCNK